MTLRNKKGPMTQQELDAPKEPCPICKTDIYLRPTMIMLVNFTCFHKMCDSCVNRIFATGSGNCPVCGTYLRKIDFVKPLFEDIVVEKECKIRRRITRIYNRTLADFEGDGKKYNDYLEKIEDIVFNLANDIDVEATNAQVEEYQKKNEKEIRNNAEKRQYENSMIKQIMQDEMRDFQDRRKADFDKVEMEHAEKAKKRQQLIDQMALSRNSAENIIQTVKADETVSVKVEPPDEPEGEDQVKRGPSLMDRLQTYQQNMVKMKDKGQKKNPFGDALASKYVRNATPFIMPRYNDPSVVPLEEEKFTAGGFSSRMVYKKALETLFLSLHAETPSDF